MHVPFGLHFPSEGVQLRLAIEGKSMFACRLCHFEIFMHSSASSIFKIMRIRKYVCYFPQPFCHKKF